MKIEYVISACGLMGVFAPKPEHEWYPEYKEAIIDLNENLIQTLQEECVNISPEISLLYNAYTEKNFIQPLSRLENLHAHNVYSDSGGLQIVTTGKSVTEEIKQEIYRRQAYSDYAMCFDDIPLKKITDKQTRNERSNVRNKIFMPEDLSNASRSTGQNISKQISFFDSIGAKTKVIVIVQGNTARDMLEFWRGIKTVLDREEQKSIGGIAIADTCMGNGDLESIEMLEAAHLIMKEDRELLEGKHLHILGVGSIARMRPVLYLSKAGYLEGFSKISFDSSSHTSTFIYGLLKVDGTCRSIGSYKTDRVERHFRNVYKRWSKIFEKYVSEDEFIVNVFGDDLGTDWKYSSIKNKALEQTDLKLIIPNILINAAHTFFQIHNFMINLDKILDHEHQVVSLKRKPTLSDVAINNLLTVKDESDMIEWVKHNRSSVKSKRISRKENKVTLEAFL